MTDISGAMEAARRIVDIDEGTSHEEFVEYLDSVAVARALLSSHPQRDGEGNRGSEPQVPAPFDPWQPISTAPKDGTPVWLASKKSGGWRLWVSDGWKKGKWLGQGARNDPVSWMCAHAPPGADANQQESKR